ncbi:hypothetical protein AbraIFM66950_006011 [Aspergillus brasiliensis]|nr:hypothetical protein AbraIFM66950_006011 [Aspergillus brasiliensis]
MAEVFTIIGLVGNIVSFVDYAYKAIVATKDAYGSATGLTQEVAKIDDIVKGIQQTSRQLLAHPSAIRLSKEELAITNTQATRCLQLAKELNGLLDKLRVREDAPRAIEITRVALQWQRKKGHIESLERRLCDLDVQVRAGLTKILLQYGRHLL